MTGWFLNFSGQDIPKFVVELSQLGDCFSLLPPVISKNRNKNKVILEIIKNVERDIRLLNEHLKYRYVCNHVGTVIPDCGLEDRYGGRKRLKS